MCTAVSYKTKNAYFGRNMDLEYSYEEQVVITPRKFPLAFRFQRSLQTHYAIIGMAYVQEEYPLYYDAMNEKGIGMAGLAFWGNAVYAEKREEKDNVAPYEFIPWVLSQCATMEEVRTLLSDLNLVNAAFSEQLPNSPMHYMISDGEESLVVEPMEDGLHIYENEIGVLTNNPPFPFQKMNLRNYRQLSRKEQPATFAEGVPLDTYSRGMGAIGLPGDLSSQSRFVRAAFVRGNSVAGDSERESVQQFFHILTSVEQQKGCVLLENGKYEYTIYSSCCSLSTGIYYYTTYDDRAITAVELHREELDDGRLKKYPLKNGEQGWGQRQSTDSLI